jgi:hypothetical protein
LNWKEDVRAITGRVLVFTSELRIPSDTPSLKYSFSGSALIFTKGKG